MSKRQPAREWEIRYIRPDQVSEFIEAGWVVEPWPAGSHHASYGTVRLIDTYPRPTEEDHEQA